MATAQFIRTGLIAVCLSAMMASASAQTDIDISPASKIALGVETVTAVPAASTSEGVSAPAIVIAPNGALQTAASPFDGVLVETLAIPGQDVQVGDDLIVVYSASYTSAAAELETRRLTMQHMAHLAERADELEKLGLRSAQEADEAHHDSLSAKLAYDALKTQMQSVRAGAQPGQFILTAPVAGTVTHVRAEAGALIGTGAPVISIFTGEQFWARAQISEREASFLQPGASVGVSETSAKGSIIAVDPEIDPMTRSLEVTAKLPAAGRWRLGSMVTLSFDAMPVEDALFLPAKAIVRIGGVETVFIETQSGFRMTPVEVISRSRNEALIRGALTAGDKVAVSGLAALKNIASGV